MGFLMHVLLLIFGPRHMELNTQLQVVVGLISNITSLYTNLVSLV